jgi:hypothetical protein
MYMLFFIILRKKQRIKGGGDEKNEDGDDEFEGEEHFLVGWLQEDPTIFRGNVHIFLHRKRK